MSTEESGPGSPQNDQPTGLPEENPAAPTPPVDDAQSADAVLPVDPAQSVDAVPPGGTVPPAGTVPLQDAVPPPTAVPPASMWGPPSQPAPSQSAASQSTSRAAWSGRRVLSIVAPIIVMVLAIGGVTATVAYAAHHTPSTAFTWQGPSGARPGNGIPTAVPTNPYPGGRPNASPSTDVPGASPTDGSGQVPSASPTDGSSGQVPSASPTDGTSGQGSGTPSQGSGTAPGNGSTNGRPGGNQGGNGFGNGNYGNYYFNTSQSSGTVLSMGQTAIVAGCSLLFGAAAVFLVMILVRRPRPTSVPAYPSPTGSAPGSAYPPA
ncbi:MAG: hypothetical protein FWD75_10310 [Propionibacteriaceae bacterium]|nr:hypothetical protein [Propionibacteriaceae bacterium]